VQATKHDGIVRLLNHGSDHNAEGDVHYNRLAYSSRTGPEFTDEQLDNHITLNGGHRTRINRIGVAEGSAASWWQAGAARIEAASVVHGRIEVRCVLIDGPAGLVRHGGYAVAGEELPGVSVGEMWAQASRADRLTSAVVGLHGYASAAVRRGLDSNAFGPHSATPYLEAQHDGKDPLVLVSAVVLSGDTVWPRQLAESIDVTVRGLHVTVRFADGTTADVQLGEEVGDGGGTAPVAGAPA
jgi:hypothetical protein